MNVFWWYLWSLSSVVICCTILILVLCNHDNLQSDGAHLQLTKVCIMHCNCSVSPRKCFANVTSCFPYFSCGDFGTLLKLHEIILNSHIFKNDLYRKFSARAKHDQLLRRFFKVFGITKNFPVKVTSCFWWFYDDNFGA